MCNWWTGKQTITASNQVKKNLTSITWICQCWDIWPIRARWQNIIWLHFRHASRLWPSFPFLSCSFGLLHSRIFSTPSSWLCSSKAPGPPVPNFCSWVTRKSLFFLSCAGYPGFYRFKAVGSLHLSLAHSLDHVCMHFFPNRWVWFQAMIVYFVILQGYIHGGYTLYALYTIIIIIQ